MESTKRSEQPYTCVSPGCGKSFTLGDGNCLIYSCLCINAETRREGVCPEHTKEVVKELEKINETKNS